ncbi:MAG: NTP transferase domain-containing protein, partial [Patescibacteria group bacterium]
MTNLDTSKLQVVILAAGKGTRMESADPKALSLLRGKYFLKHILDTVESLGLELKPVIVVGHKKERIFEELGRGLNYAHQTEQLGTGHAVLSAKANLDHAHEDILVLSTDQPLTSKETLAALIDTHLKNKATVTLATALLPDFEDWRKGVTRFGRIVRDRDGLLERIVEYKDANDEEIELREVNPAVYVFSAKWLGSNIDNLKNENTQKEYYI